MPRLWTAPDLAPADPYQLQPGFVAPSGPLPYRPDAQTMVANRAHFSRFVPSVTRAVTSVGFLSTTLGVAGDEVDVGIYTSTLSRIVSSGATAGKLNVSTSAVTTVAIASTVLQAGTVYYAAISTAGAGGAAYGGTTPQLWGADLFAAAGGTGFGASAPNASELWKGSAHPLPAGPVSPDGSTFTAILWLK